jgi:UDP-glucose 4-epimerase
MDRGRRVLVTGGAGYIGSHMVRTLIQEGYEVIAFDDLSNGTRSSVAPEAHFVHASIADECVMQEALRDVSAVFHFAGSIQVGESTRNPSLYYHNNVSCTLSLLQSIALAGVKALIVSSTAAVYASSNAPLKEDDRLAPESPYGETKATVERALPYFRAAHGIESVCLRYFNAAGAEPLWQLSENHEPETHLVPLAIDAARGKRPPLTVFGNDYPTPDGTCVRDYVHVRDLCDAHLVALQKLRANGLPHAAYNLGGGQGTSVKEVLAAVETVLGTPVPFTQGKRRDGDAASLVASIERARTDLGFSPTRSSIERLVRDAAESRGS